MLFPSGEFLFVYLPIVLAGFFLLARLSGVRVAAAWLALSSFFFYGFWRIEDLPLLAGSIAFNYFAGWLIQRGSPTVPVSSRSVLTIAISVNLLLLAYFKYSNFLMQSAAAVLGVTVGPVDVTLPIGISFFTFTQIAYLVDSYAGKVHERNPLHYALFVTYFPHLIAGPVLHHAEMMPQFARSETYRPRVTFMVLGLAFLAVGLVKKVLVADSAAPFANALFDSAGSRSVGAAEAWHGVLAYTIQIYYDFSGYSDMAVGLSLLFGVRLPYNFDSPYKARSIIDFWRRWHMTLSRFLRDYLYVALGGNRRGVARRYLNLGITMLLGGLWHGASWTFVAWGGLHGAFLIVNHGWRHFRHGAAKILPWLESPNVRPVGNVLALALTLISVMVAWVFFRAAGFADAAKIVLAMFGSVGETSVGIGETTTGNWFWLAIALTIAIVAPNSQQMIDKWLRPRLEKLLSSLAVDLGMGAAIGASVVAIAMLAFVSASREVSEFIYFNF
jgi:D-alanyl-lipoteichoic acid acyltransferase DltB (MBOAT superfamily)